MIISTQEWTLRPSELPGKRLLQLHMDIFTVLQYLLEDLEKLFTFAIPQDIQLYTDILTVLLRTLSDMSGNNNIIIRVLLSISFLPETVFLLSRVIS